MKPTCWRNRAKSKNGKSNRNNYSKYIENVVDQKYLHGDGFKKSTHQKVLKLLG